MGKENEISKDLFVFLTKAQKGRALLEKEEELADFESRVPDDVLKEVMSGKDEDTFVREIAAKIFVQRMNNLEIEEYVDWLTDECWMLREAAVNKLKGITDREIVDSLSWTAFTDENPRIRKAAVVALGALMSEKDCGARIVDVLMRAFGDRDPEVRLAAVYCFAKNKDADSIATLWEDVVAAIIRMIKDSDVRVARDAIYCLREIGIRGFTAKRVISVLVCEIECNNWPIASFAMEVLSDSKDVGIIKIMQKVARSDTMCEEARKQAKKILAKKSKLLRLKSFLK